LRNSERKVLLFLVDVLLLNFALMVAWVVGNGTPDTLALVLTPYKWYITLTVVWGLVALFFDVYDLARAASTMNSVRSVAAAVVTTVLVYTFIPQLTPPLISRGIIFIFGGLALASIVTWRIVYANLFAQPRFTQRALVVGAGLAGRTLVEALKTVPDDANPYRGTGYQIMGFVDDSARLNGLHVQGVPVLGAHNVLVPMAQALDVDEIILAITHRHDIVDGLFDELLRCRELGLRVTTMSTIYERLLGRVPVQHIGRNLSDALPMDEDAGHRLYLVAKRIVDFSASWAGMVLLALVIPFVAIANRTSSPGPLFYRQWRVGAGGRPFQCIKFRSMVPDAEKHTGAVWAKSGDDRITPAGRFMRKTRIDELPQFINVLRGEMSLIGPRPERPEFVENLAKSIPFYRARHAVRPGITGWAQVQYRYGNTVDDSRIKLEYDLYYVKNASTLLDLRIVLRTISVMLQLKGQ
jgi:exopolysaccharide biosynthesis polyprenyl glycosylphosphotransferase